MVVDLGEEHWKVQLGWALEWAPLAVALVVAPMGRIQRGEQ